MRIISANKQVRSSDDAPTSFTLPAVPIYFHPGVLRTTFTVVRRDDDRYRDPAENPEEAGERKVAEGVDLDDWLKGDLLWRQAVDASDVT